MSQEQQEQQVTEVVADVIHEEQQVPEVAEVIEVTDITEVSEVIRRKRTIQELTMVQQRKTKRHNLMNHMKDYIALLHKEADMVKKPRDASLNMAQTWLSSLETEDTQIQQLLEKNAPRKVIVETYRDHLEQNKTLAVKVEKQYVADELEQCESLFDDCRELMRELQECMSPENVDLFLCRNHHSGNCSYTPGSLQNFLLLSVQCAFDNFQTRIQEHSTRNIWENELRQ